MFIAKIATRVPSRGFDPPIQLPTIDDSIQPLPVINGIISSPLSIAIIVFPSVNMSIGPLANIVVFNLDASSLIISALSFKFSSVIMSSTLTSTPFAVLLSSNTPASFAIAFISLIFPRIAVIS